MVAVHEQKCYVLILSKTSEAGWTERFLSEKKLDFVMITRTLNYNITPPHSPPPPPIIPQVYAIIMDNYSYNC